MGQFVCYSTITSLTMLTLTFALLLVSPCLGANIVDTLVASNKASTLVKLVTQAGLADTLKGGMFTVLAPTDAAFSKVPAATLTSLQNDNAALADLLKYHVIAGSVRSSNLRDDQEAATLDNNQDKVRFNVYSHNHAVTANGAKVSQADVTCSNGVIHYIDDVIMPRTKTIVDLVASDPELSTLLKVVTDAGIANEFLANPLTVFAPTNAAFAAMDQSQLAKLSGDANRLKDTLLYHGVPQTMYSAGLYNHEFEKTSDSHQDRLQVRVHGSTVTINNAAVTAADIQAKNGVVHKINKVLVPLRVKLWLTYNIGK